MAVPSAVTRRAEREAADLVAQGIDPNGPPPGVTLTPVPSSSAAPAAPQPTTPTEDPAALRARIAELEAAESTQSGRASASATEAAELKRQLEAVQANRTFLENQLTDLTGRLQTLESENTTIKQQSNTTTIDKAVESLTGAGLTAEQIAAFEPDTVAMVDAVAKKAMAAVILPLVERIKAMETSLGRLKELDKLPHLEQVAQVSAASEAQRREMEFMRKEILSHYPDFETVRETPEWKAYLAQDIPGRGIKIAHLLNSYRQAANAVGLRSILAMFYEKQKAAPSLNSLVVPAKTNADVPTTPAEAKIKASEYNHNLRSFTSKKMVRADWDAFRARFEQALAAGNVEMDVEIR